MPYELRLRAYAPNGAQTGILPVPSKIDASFPLGDVGALALEYANAAPGASLLAVPAEIALEYQDAAGNWQEAPGARWMNLKDAGDEVKDGAALTFTCPSYIWRLSKARVLPGSPSLLDVNGKRAFLSVSAGTILRTLAQEAQTRGALAGLDFTSFTGATDSAGVAWDTTLSIAYEPGLDYLAIMLNLFLQGVIDFQTQGRVVQVYNGDGRSIDRTIQANPVDLRRGRDLTEAPRTRTREFLADYAFVQGDANVTLERTNAAAEKPWGRWETYLSHSGVTDPGTMTVLADAELANGGQARVEHTHGLSFQAAAWVPFRDYAPGDYVFSDVGTGPVRYRVRQITIQVDSKRITTGNVVLNDLLLEREIRQARRVQGISGGSTLSGGSGAALTDPPSLDTVAPKAPAGLTVTSAAYLDTRGNPTAQVSAAWVGVTLNADNTAMTDLDYYDAFWRHTGVAAERNYLGKTAGTRVDYSPLPVGMAIEVWVNAVDRSGNRSPDSALVAVTTATDATAPAVPSTPAVAVFLGDLQITWDGLLAGPSAPPPDFDRVDAHVSTVSGFTPSTSTRFGSLSGAGYVSVNAAYGVPLFVRFVAIDKSGNTSAPSVQASGTPVRVSGLDVAPSAIAAAAIAAGAIDSSKLLDLAVTTVKIADAAITGVKIVASAITAGHLAAGSVTTDKLTVGSARPSLVINGTFEEGLAGWVQAWETGTSGGVFSPDGNAAVVVSGTQFATFGNPGDNVTATSMASRAFPVVAGQELVVSSLLRSSAANAWYLRILYGTSETFPRTGGTAITVACAAPADVRLFDLAGNIVVAGGMGSGGGPGTQDIVGSYGLPAQSQWFRAEGRVRVPASATWARVAVYSWTRAGGVVSYDSVDDIRAIQAVNVVSITDGSITASKIVAGAITAGSAIIGNAAISNAQIASIQADKITAGTMAAAYIVVGTRLTTKTDASQTGARLEFDPTGVKAYNAAGTYVAGLQADGSLYALQGAIGGFNITSSLLFSGATSGAPNSVELSNTGYIVAYGNTGSFAGLDSRAGNPMLRVWNGTLNTFAADKNGNVVLANGSITSSNIRTNTVGVGSTIEITDSKTSAGDRINFYTATSTVPNAYIAAYGSSLASGVRIGGNVFIGDSESNPLSIVGRMRRRSVDASSWLETREVAGLSCGATGRVAVTFGVAFGTTSVQVIATVRQGGLTRPCYVESVSATGFVLHVSSGAAAYTAVTAGFDINYIAMHVA